MLAFILNHAKYLPSLQALQAEHHWKEGFELQELMEANLLIIGAGGIGQAIAQRKERFRDESLGLLPSPRTTTGV